MIAGITEEQFTHLPTISLNYPCDRCGKKNDYGRLMRDFKDYSFANDGTITAKDTRAALYLCAGCHWQMTCEYFEMDKESKQRIQQMMSNEARWLQKVSRLPIQELASRVGVSRQAYHKWLKGKTITPEHKTRLKEMIAIYVSEEVQE